LNLLNQIVSAGAALAYLPDHIVEASGHSVVEVVKCPFVCKQTVRLVCHEPQRLGWLSTLWRTI
jgi:DNA-binding transcriptional LysR family regulator